MLSAPVGRSPARQWGQSLGSTVTSTQHAPIAPSSAHYQIFSAEPATPVRWRLLSGNNRDLGRGLIDFASAAECRDGITLLQKALTEFEDSDVSWRRVGHQWTWVLMVDGEPTVAAGGSYDRRIRCEQSLNQFLMLAPVASVGEVVMFSASRRWPANRTHGAPVRAVSPVDRPR